VCGLNGKRKGSKPLTDFDEGGTGKTGCDFNKARPYYRVVKSSPNFEDRTFSQQDKECQLTVGMQQISINDHLTPETDRMKDWKHRVNTHGGNSSSEWVDTSPGFFRRDARVI